MAVSRALRFQVLRRDQYRCHYCGATAAEAKLTVDHITAVALGGTDTPDNLVTACEPCNGGKSATPADAALVAQVQERDTQFRAAVADATQEDRGRRWFAEAFLDAWDLGELPPGWRKTIDAYRQQGLPSDVWDEIVAIARGKANLDDPFRYCCGIARNQIKKIQEQAAKQIAGSATIAADAEPLDALAQAALLIWAETWESEFSQPPTEEQANAIRESLAAFRSTEDGEWIEPDRLIKALRNSVWLNESPANGIPGLLDELNRSEQADVAIEWGDVWCKVGDDSPPGKTYQAVADQIKTLAEGGVSLTRALRAAVFAGIHNSTILHFGLHPKELELIEVWPDAERSLDIWAASYRNAADHWPSSEDREAFRHHLRRIGAAHRYQRNDVYAAAAAAGAYLDPDITTCLPLRGSVFEAAATPLAS